MTVDITHDCIWILNADKHLRFLQSKHLQCILSFHAGIKERRHDTDLCVCLLVSEVTLSDAMIFRCLNSLDVNKVS